jgi:2-polyprenyl-3-methyl-5-hydroxy-6-metoxy-1,4-benzoquinol methylase
MTKKHTLIRDCIICGSTNSSPVFTYTFDFLTGVRSHPPEDLLSRGWDQERTQTIVRCSKCGCHYVRDIFTEYQGGAKQDRDSLPPLTTAQVVESQATRDAQFCPQHSVYLRQTAAMMADLMCCAREQSTQGLKVMDFGAGGSPLSQLARILGASVSVAYDPSYRHGYQEVFNKSNFRDIVACRDTGELRDLGPFNLVTCQGVIEHVVDPKAELKLMYEVMESKGLLYINNPNMDLGRDLNALKAAEKIVKKDRLSHYHPKHYNYMTQNEFLELISEVGFKLTPMVCYLAMPPMGPGFIKQNIVQSVKRSVRYLQNMCGIPYHRETFVLQKP